MLVGIRSGRPRYAVLVSVVAATAMVAAACGPSTPGAVASPSPVGETPRAGGNLRVLLQIDAVTLDPHKTIETAAKIYVDQLYDPLLEFIGGEIKPGLAESWQMAPDGLTYTFKLRNNVKFHGGRTLTSEDVKYSFSRIIDPKTASQYKNSLAAVTEIQTPDPLTVVLKLREPFIPLTANLTSPGLSIVDKEVVEKQGDLSKSDGGTGPFMLDQWSKDQQLTVKKNPNYWKTGRPYLDGITFTFNNDVNAASAALRSGTVDFLFRAGPTVLNALKADSTLQVNGPILANWQFLAMNTQKAPFTDPRVRQAIMYALDREQLLQLGKDGNGKVLQAGFIPADRLGGLKSPVYGAPNVDKAKQLLRDAGLPNGFNTTIRTVTRSDLLNSSLGIQQQLKAIGVTVEVVQMDVAAFLAIISPTAPGNFDMFYLGIAETVDPDERLSSMFLTGGGTNWGRFSDSELDKLIVDARRTTDTAQRAKLYEQTQTILTTRGPMAFTYGAADFDVTIKKVKGYVTANVQSYRSLQDTWLGP